MSDSRRKSEIHLASPVYPEKVKELEDPPEVLYVRGDPAALSTPCLSIIGARKATP